MAGKPIDLLSKAERSMIIRSRLNTPESRKKKREEEKVARLASRAAKEAARHKSEHHLEARMPWPVRLRAREGVGAETLMSDLLDRWWHRLRLWVLGRVVCPTHGETDQCAYWPYADFECGRCQTALRQKEREEYEQREHAARIAEYAAAIRRCKPEVVAIIREIMDEEKTDA